MASAQSTNRVNFTRGRVERFACPAGKAEAFLWDAKTPGLGIRARQGGSRHYVFQARLHGRNLRIDAKDTLLITEPEAWGLPSTGLGSNYIIAREDFYFVYPTNFNEYQRQYKDSFQHGGISMEEKSVHFDNSKNESLGWVMTIGRTVITFISHCI